MYADPVLHEGAGAAGDLLLLCDHASNRIPAEYAGLGLSSAALDTHIAWDPGALGVARRMAAAAGGEIIAGGYSRLLIDVNRDPSAPDSIVTRSESTDIPGNRDLEPAERRRRIAGLYEPFHAAIDRAIAARAARGQRTLLVAVHSFTPVYAGNPRPWHVGVLFDHDRRLADPLIAALRAELGPNVGINQPYSPSDRVYHTLSRHGEALGLPCTMIEIRNDLIAEAEGEQAWADRLVRALGLTS